MNRDANSAHQGGGGPSGHRNAGAMASVRRGSDSPAAFLRWRPAVDNASPSERAALFFHAEAEAFLFAHDAIAGARAALEALEDGEPLINVLLKLDRAGSDATRAWLRAGWDWLYEPASAA